MITTRDDAQDVEGRVQKMASQYVNGKDRPAIHWRAYEFEVE